MALTKTKRRNRIKSRVKKVISGTAERPRLSVFRSNKQIYAQLVDDVNATTLVAAGSTEKEIVSEEGNKSEKAAMVGKLIAKKAKDAGFEKVVFDRSGYLYHGRVKQLADAAREGGLKF
ncbi:LSU ribosomal protein L18P [Tangfeifania diversioriginum]|uniref:Large ribosomal subunit protein uL18 n=1 Tax=Tangfeifania diversioriginum TaxID=1168035 RepID=A0A1M6NGH8_9BACT|nr:50S ribosomal protein L18 [Tangfeifania diversioriginum]SHJ94704.1 LSU ribosomal protein L18P [Tangfeifania diversioriginum]